MQTNNPISKKRKLDLPALKLREFVAQEYKNDSYVDVYNKEINVGSFEAFTLKVRDAKEENFVSIFPLDETFVQSSVKEEYIQNSKITNYFPSMDIPDSGFSPIKLPKEEKASLNTFVEFFKNVAEKIDLKKETFVNCKAGMSRSVLFAGCLASVKEGLKNDKEITKEEFLNILQDVKEKRYKDGTTKGKSIALQYPTEFKNPQNSSAKIQNRLDEYTLLKCAENNEFKFTDKLLDAINDRIKNKNQNNGLTI